MTLDTILLCWLCRNPSILRIDLTVDVKLGAPRFWCRHCLKPRRFHQMLQRRLAQIEADPDMANAEELATIHALLERDGEECRAEGFDRPLGAARLAA